MTVRQQWALVLGVVVLLGGGLFAATRLLRHELFPVTIGTEAPQFVAQTLDAEPATRTLADYRGQVVLLNIWATWCLPCREEMPSIQALHERFASEGLEVVAVSVDQPNSEQAIRDFAAEYGLTFELLHDPTGDIQQQYQTTGVPETFIIGADGVIRRKQIGHTDWNSPANRALVGQLLGVSADEAVQPAVDARGDAPAARDVPAAPDTAAARGAP